MEKMMARELMWPINTLSIKHTDPKALYVDSCELEVTFVFHVWLSE